MEWVHAVVGQLYLQGMMLQEELNEKNRELVALQAIKTDPRPEPEYIDVPASQAPSREDGAANVA